MYFSFVALFIEFDSNCRKDYTTRIYTPSLPKRTIFFNKRCFIEVLDFIKTHYLQKLNECKCGVSLTAPKLTPCFYPLDPDSN